MLELYDNVFRIFNFCFFVITAGMIGNLLNTEHGHHSSRVNYCMFPPAWGLVSDSFYGILANLVPEPFAFPPILFAFDFLNFVFTFTAGTVLAVGIRTHSCTNKEYRRENYIIQGSERRCREAQACIAFFYFSMFLFLVKVLITLVTYFTGGELGQTGYGGGYGGRSFGRRPRTRAPPQMNKGGISISQV
ncbi:hypothetical protein TBLA_0D02960 [Henningerozyma blattae CBS 6284]|uniref:MARVEL domain-containing protein n=1 Tax=Henningerozyma blattae (strain ATCC 34711 / CBS 6284 / DSM 70876 / NBRC 10599 / NRRL Y-10934 / UCD 77-7) TaxID=1071380 RepID=I2H344_HENB6|nr:hypothetical protein TBLA_0D02960 [Tetrapisispora blattae CBS 6284]CCH60796.1 hypothetical protein TBLA_0D02960 [Tetrapisispora blattae CBS 6284]